MSTDPARRAAPEAPGLPERPGADRPVHRRPREPASGNWTAHDAAGTTRRTRTRRPRRDLRDQRHHEPLRRRPAGDAGDVLDRHDAQRGDPRRAAPPTCASTTRTGSRTTRPHRATTAACVEISTNGGASYSDIGSAADRRRLQRRRSTTDVGQPAGGPRRRSSGEQRLRREPRRRSTLARRPERALPLPHRHGHRQRPARLGWFVDDVQIYTCAPPRRRRTATATACRTRATRARSVDARLRRPTRAAPAGPGAHGARPATGGRRTAAPRRHAPWPR